ncbi:MAG: hypothetical protein V5A68_05120 [Candidatus Thermoplasmatota archaeon]
MKGETRINIPIYNKPWFDNGLITFYDLLRSINSEIGIGLKLNPQKISFTLKNTETFLEQLLPEISAVENNLIVIGKEDENVEKEIKKDFLILQEGKKVNGKVRFKEKFYNEELRKSFLKKSVKILGKEGGKRKCIVCGRQYNVKAGNIKRYLKLKQSIYPLSTKIKSLSGVRSHGDGTFLRFSKTYHDNLCPLCYMIGALNWANRGIVYRTFISDKYSYILLPNMDNLAELNEFRNSYLELLNNESRYSNIRVEPDKKETENTAGKYSTLLCFYEKFLFNINIGIICKEWQIMKVPLGNVKNVSTIEVSINEDILGVLQNLYDKGIQVYNYFIKRVNFFMDKNIESQKIDWDITNEIRENLSKHFIKDDFYKFARTLMPKRGGHVGYSSNAHEKLGELLYEWRIKNMNLEKENLEYIKKIGNIIAKTSGTAPTLLYKIDKARNFNDLLDALRQVSRKMAGLDKKDIKGKISPGSFDNLIEILKTNENNWSEIRNLLVIYSSMYYSLNKFRDRGE